MCGIAGFVGGREPVATEAVRRMTDALARRGPDGSGLACMPHAVLGHRRLAIFDLSDAGRQPMASPDGAIRVVYNGAIYNFHALRADLRARGYAFTSQTDTEVLVHGYREWGIDGLVSRVQGMFAIGLWDESIGRLFLVRDRLGVKPLLYALRDGSIAFASTVRALRSAGCVSELDPDAVAEFLEFGYVPDAWSIYQGATKLPAATIGEWDGSTLRLRRYWESPRPDRAGATSFEDAVVETERLLLAAVETRLQADVPVGALLSGGVDSGLVCWAIRQLGGDVTAFTVGAPGHPSDETADAVATATELGIAHRVLALSDDDTPRIEELIAAYAEPFACQSALGMLRVSEAVAQTSVKVLLTGDGGDDVFLGYPRHRHLQMVERLARSTPGFVSGLWPSLRGAVRGVPAMRRSSHFLDYVAGGLPAYLDAHDGLPGFRARGLLGERLAGARVTERGRPWSRASARDILGEYLRHDLHGQFVAEYLTKVDGATMYWALEARSPFFDQSVWEYAASLPTELRLHGGTLKAVLREIARRRISPRMASGRKRGFTVPVERWIAGRWRRAVEERFADSLLADEGWIRKEPVLRALRDAPADGQVSHHIWYLLVLEEWMRAERTGRAAAAAA